MRVIIYEGVVLAEVVINATISNLNKMVYDEYVSSLSALYTSFLELIKKQESSYREEPGTECVILNDLDTYIHYTIDENYDVVIARVVW